MDIYLVDVYEHKKDGFGALCGGSHIRALVKANSPSKALDLFLHEYKITPLAKNIDIVEITFEDSNVLEVLRNEW